MEVGLGSTVASLAWLKRAVPHRPCHGAAEIYETAVFGRAKLIRPTRKGRRVLAHALRTVHEIEQMYAEEVGPEKFDALVSTLQALLDARS